MEGSYRSETQIFLVQVFQNHFCHIGNGSTNRRSGAWRQCPPAENITTVRKTWATVWDGALAYREEGGPGELLGRQSKTVGKHFSRHFCETSNSLPASSCALSGPVPILSPVGWPNMHISNVSIPPSFPFPDEILQQVSFAFSTKFKSLNLAQSLPRAGPGLPPPLQPTKPHAGFEHIQLPLTSWSLPMLFPLAGRPISPFSPSG